jgi:DNA-binding winged helix-turn-helix (wHTH) protein/tetratricopeptide (TPR) repeat protein
MSTDGGRHESIAFSSFRLDLRSGQLFGASGPVALRPKTWSVLVYLAERPGVLVSKEELLDAVWPDVAVTPDTLTKSISELRQALGDDAVTQRFITTVHRRGFRFIGDTPARDETARSWRDRSAGARPFVGRAEELGHLADALGRAAAGDRQIVFVTGAAGIGKTSLVETFLARAASQSPMPPWIARGTAVEQHGPREPYMPVLKALDRLARRPDAEHLIGLLRRAAPTWLAQMPWLIGDDEVALRHSLRSARAERMLREFAALVEALTTDVTLLLVLEDLHWCDSATTDLLAVLGERREPARLLVIATYRPADLAVQEHPLAHAIHTMQFRRQCVELPVHDFSEADVRSYLAHRFPGARLPANLGARLHAHTDGNPLFVAAVVDHLLSRGWILDTDPGWSAAPALDAADLGIPDDVRRMITAQFETLGPSDRRLLAAASVAGHEFTPQAIAAPLRGDLDDVEARCETLARSQRFLRFAGSEEAADGRVAQRFAFTHELHRQAVYEGIPAGTRQRLHQRIGETLENSYGDRAPAIAALLATHFERGADAQRALHYLTVAAAGAQQRFAGREAIRYLESAIALTARLPDPSARLRRELELRIALAPLLNDLNGFASDELLANCERAHEVCVEVGTSTQLFQVLYALCHVHVVRAELTLTQTTLQQLDDLARQFGTAEHRLLTDSAFARCYSFQGRFSEARRIFEGPLASARRAGVAPNPPAHGPDPVIMANAHCAYVLWFLGHPDRARTIVRAALVEAGRTGVSPFTQAAALGLSALLEMLCRNPSDVARLAEQLSTVSAEYGFRFWAAIGSALSGWARISCGQVGEGIAEIERARALHAATGARLFSTHILAFLAEAHLGAGDVATGLERAEEGLRLAETTFDRSYWPELWRLNGELLLARSGTERGRTATSSRKEGEACLRRALDLAGEMEAKSLELRAATSLARAWLERGRAADAAKLLAGILACFADSPESPDLRDARALQDHCSPARRSKVS